MFELSIALPKSATEIDRHDGPTAGPMFTKRRDLEGL